ncbi:indoleamine 2,3-dioxygenase 2 isoform X3 [Heliangelus exortis]|uniref:indoleamine 2,3-dioxygenase 2 isoform X3 n=1 Tax=Heliangelus exortis TaxID=472823 RepID=UPI003A9545BF
MFAPRQRLIGNLYPPVFARTLRPSGGRALLPRDKVRVSPGPSGGCWLSTNPSGAGGAVLPSCSTPDPAPSDGGRGGDGGDPSGPGAEQVPALRGVRVPPAPAPELPAPYSPWMEIAHDLPQLITSHQLRSRVLQMPQLRTQQLRGREELHLAHLVLSFITMGYLWQEGEEGTVKVLPQNLAVPFWEVSQALGLPPILSHADFVLANWRRKNPNGPLEIENLDTIISLPGGESLRGFILVTLLVEKAAVPGIKAIVQAIRAVLQLDEETLHEALQELAEAIGNMSKALTRMHDYVDPAVFYTVIRIFLSGAVSNTAVPLPGFSGGFYFYFPSAYLGIPKSKGSLHPHLVLLIFYPS